jgi:hypothetical protein
MRCFHGASFPGEIHGHGWHVTDDGVRTMLVAAGTKLYTLLEGGDPVELSMAFLPVVDQVRTEPDVVHFISLSGGTATTFIYDGVNQNLKFEGDKLTKMGITTPGTAPTPSLAGAGSLSAGLRKAVITLKSAHHESDCSAVVRDFSATVGQKATFASPTQGVDYDDPQVLTWCVYASIAGGAELHFVDEKAIGVNIEVGTLTYAPGVGQFDTIVKEKKLVSALENTPPPAPAVALAEHRGQLAGVFADDLGLVRFTALDPDFMVPEGWPEIYVQPVRHSDGDHLTALASMYEWLVCFKQFGAHAIVGDKFEDYTVVPVLAAEGGKRIGSGCFNPGTCLMVENAVLFCAADGIYRADRYASPTGGIVAERISGAIDDLYAAAKFSLGASCFFDRIHRLFGFLGHG